VKVLQQFKIQKLLLQKGRSLLRIILKKLISERLSLLVKVLLRELKVIMTKRYHYINNFFVVVLKMKVLHREILAANLDLLKVQFLQELLNEFSKERGMKFLLLKMKLKSLLKKRVNLLDGFLDFLLNKKNRKNFLKRIKQKVN